MLASALDEKEASEVASNVQATIARLARNLGNDDQALPTVKIAWHSICNLLTPERFESRSPLRLTVSYAIVDVMAEAAAVSRRLKEIQAEHSTRSRQAEAYKVGRSLDLLNDVRADLERRFCKSDIQDACAARGSIRSAYAGFRFFELAEFCDDNVNRIFLSDVAKAYADYPVTVLASSCGFF